MELINTQMRSPGPSNLCDGGSVCGHCLVFLGEDKKVVFSFSFICNTLHITLLSSSLYNKGGASDIWGSNHEVKGVG